MLAENDFEQCYRQSLRSPVAHWLESLPSQTTEWQKSALHGDFKKWCELVDKMLPH